MKPGAKHTLTVGALRVPMIHQLHTKNAPCRRLAAGCVFLYRCPRIQPARNLRAVAEYDDLPVSISAQQRLYDRAVFRAVAVHLVEQVNKLSRIKRELYQNLGREATNEELADESGIEE